MRDSPVEHSTLHILVDRHDVVGPKPGWDPALGSVGKNGRGKGYILLSPISYLGLTWTRVSRPVLRKSHGATHLRRSMPGCLQRAIEARESFKKPSGYGGVPMSKELRPGELLVCQIVAAFLFAIVSGFLLIKGVESLY